MISASSELSRHHGGSLFGSSCPHAWWVRCDRWRGRGKKEGELQSAPRKNFAPDAPDPSIRHFRILQAHSSTRELLPTKPNRNSYYVARSTCRSNVVRKNTRRCSGSGSRHCDGPCLCIRSCQRQRSANHVARRHGPETGCGDGTSQKSSQVREHHPGMCI